MALSSLAVLGVRVTTAVAYVVFSLVLVSATGAETTGITLGAIAAIELAAVAGRLGVPVVLTRLRRLGGPESALPAGMVLASMLAAGGLGGLVALPIAGFEPGLEAALAGAAVALGWFLLPLAPSLRAAGALSLGLVVQNGLSALATWRGEQWLASPAMAGRVARMARVQPGWQQAGRRLERRLREV